MSLFQILMLIGLAILVGLLNDILSELKMIRTALASLFLRKGSLKVVPDPEEEK